MAHRRAKTSPGPCSVANLDPGRPRHRVARLSKEDLRSALHDVAAKVARDDRVAAQGQDVKPPQDTKKYKEDKIK